jgi:predicted DNA-binding protein (MmcQ/YjbR family)
VQSKKTKATYLLRNLIPKLNSPTLQFSTLLVVSISFLYLVFKIIGMNIELLRHYCISKIAVTEEFPFDENTLVFKVLGKVFALTSLKGWEEGIASINLKCDPEKAVELRGEYDSIKPGFHMSKKHWNTIELYQKELSKAFIQQLIDNSYHLVIKGMTKKQQAELVNYQ